MLTFPDGYSIAQTGAITVALGEAVGLAPASPAGKAKAMQLMDDGADINTEMGAGKPVERIAKWMDHFEAQLGDNDYFVDNKLSYADFHLFPVSQPCLFPSVSQTSFVALSLMMALGLI